MTTRVWHCNGYDKVDIFGHGFICNKSAILLLLLLLLLLQSRYGTCYCQ